MKKVLLLILPILLIITLVFAVLGFFQVKTQEENLKDDLYRKAKNVSEGMELSARQAFEKNDIRIAQKLADKFQKRDRLQGCILYNSDGKILGITEKITELYNQDKQLFSYVAKTLSPSYEYRKYLDYALYSYVMPVVDDESKFLGAIELVYDIAYINDSLAKMWKRISIALLILSVLMAFIIFLIQRQIFFLPVRRLTDWLKMYYKGEIDDSMSIKDIGEIGNLASEVEQIALGLRVARRSVSDKATARLEKESIWNEQKLKDLVRSKLGENALFVVSNREPYMHVTDETTGKAKCMRPASGVVTALDPVMKACGGLWIAHGSGNADKQFVNSKDKLGVPPEDTHYILKRLWLSKPEEEGFYYGFSNEGLWPLCHITYTRPEFRESDWQMYKKVNQKFADSILEELPKQAPLIFIQDYHFTLLPQMIKEKRPDAIIAMFWHIPWPNPEVFSICPYQNEILEGMLGCDLMCFHVQYHCNNFIDTVNRMLECRVDMEKFSIVRANKETSVRAFPISVDNFMYDKYATSKTSAADIDEIIKEFNLEGKIVGLGVERIDYTKGIVERINAIDRFFDKYPQYKSRFVFIQLAAPSRSHIKKYQALISEIDELVERVNWKHSENGWKPLIYLKRHFSGDEIKPYYALADLCIVSSLHDGMNLVAKEYVASKNDLKGALVLSCFTGAAREFIDAVQVNPYATERFAEAIRYAIEIPEDEKARRMRNMRKIIADSNVYKWAGSIINDLTALRKTEQ